MIWVSAVIQGILVGGLYALFACGLSLMFGVMNVINLAHGDLAVVAAYLALGVIAVTHIPAQWSFLIVVPIFAAIGYVVQRTLIQASLNRGVLTTLLVTFGLSVVIENALLQFLSADSRSVPVSTNLVVASFSIGSQITIAYLDLVIFAVAVVVLLGLHYFLFPSRDGRLTRFLSASRFGASRFGASRFGRLIRFLSRYGLLIRAVADDREAAQLAGASYRHVFGIAAAIAFGTVALAGIAYGTYQSFDPSIGANQLLLFAFEAVVIGGLGSLWGTLLGGIVLGVAQAIGAQIGSNDQFLLGQLVFLAVLVLRPQGITGARRRAA